MSHWLKKTVNHFILLTLLQSGLLLIFVCCFCKDELVYSATVQTGVKTCWDFSFTARTMAGTADGIFPYLGMFTPLKNDVVTWQVKGLTCQGQGPAMPEPRGQRAGGVGG